MARGTSFTFLVIALITFITGYSLKDCNAQPLSTESKRAAKLFEEGRKNFGLQNYEEASQYLKKAISADDQFLEAYMLLGDVLKSLDDNQAAVDIYEKVISINPDKYPEVYYFCGLLHFDLQQYDAGIEKLTHFLSVEQKKSLRIKEAQFYLACSRFAKNALSNPVPFQTKNLGKNINTGTDEFINAVSSDELRLYFTGQDPTLNAAREADRFFYSSRINVGDEWRPSQLAGPPLNTLENQGALTITPDGRYLLFAGCQWPDGLGSCDIYAAKITDGQFGEPQNLGNKVNSNAWDSQPSLSSDGRTLYFTSNRSGGYGKSDIWKSYLQDDGNWSTPENLGSTINTFGSEMAPFIHPDGATLYFSSDRHAGMGGIDLFVSRQDENDNWSEPLNLGYPINTHGDEFNIVVNAKGDNAYISARLPEGIGGYDVYQFELHQAIRPHPSTYVKGIVADAKTLNPLNAFFVLFDLDTGKEMVRSFSDEKTGEFLICLPTDRDYALNVSKEDYLFHSENFALTGIYSDLEPYQMNISLSPILTGETIILKNIFFDTGKSELKPESISELTRLFEFLQSNPSVKIEISGHTDNIGGDEYNLSLSNSRAKSVVDYLIANGIHSDRLQYKGYGFSLPVSDNDTEDGRASNRRTEFKVIQK